MLKSFLLISVSLLFLTGCVQERIGAFSNVGGTFEKKEVVLRDIPLPQDFIMAEGSFCRGSDSFRYGEFLLHGELSVDDIFFYYKKQMPAYYWKEIASEDRESSARMQFVKADEICTILCREGARTTEVKIIVEQAKA